MLVQFKVSNFLSFDKLQTFNMRAGKFRNFSDRVSNCSKYKLLKFMSIYGANASGKSNLISAFGFFQDLVLGHLDNGSYSCYCKLSADNRLKDSLFEITIEIDGKVFVYGFNILLSSASFTHEWLYEELKNGSKQSVFERNIIDGTITIGNYLKSSPLLERIKIYGDDVKSDDTILFLKLMNQNKENLYINSKKIIVFRNIYNWIRFKLSVNTAENPITNYSWFIDSNNLDKIAKKLQGFSTGIETISVVNVSPEKVMSNLPKEMINRVQQMLSEPKNQLPTSKNEKNNAVLIRTSYNSMFLISINNSGEFEYKTFEFTHNNSSATFLLDEESDGTVRLLDLIEILLNNTEGKVYIIDEINRMFHPLLTRKFIIDFLEIAKERNIQLIVTTHESQLMDLKLLRKDEINFINKNDEGYSTIESLEKYDDRFDKKIINEYFNGKYGAIPFLTEKNIQ